MTGAPDPAIIECDPWLNQGDVFQRIPVWQAGMMNRQNLAIGAALLISHGCVLDKAKRNGQPMIEFMNFVPLQSFAALEAANANKAGELKRRAESGSDTPYQVLYLGEVDGVGESYVSLAQPYSLPAELFKVDIREFSSEETGDFEEDADNRRLVAGAHSTRVGRLNPSLLAMFHRKWVIHWTGQRPVE